MRALLTFGRLVLVRIELPRELLAGHDAFQHTFSATATLPRTLQDPALAPMRPGLIIAQRAHGD